MHTAGSAAVHRVAEYLKMPADCILLDFCVGGEAIIPIKDIKNEWRLFPFQITYFLGLICCEHMEKSYSVAEFFTIFFIDGVEVELGSYNVKE